MKITNIEAIPLRIPTIDAQANDGAQETVIIKVHTDAGITGIGEVDATPFVIKAVIESPSSHNWGLSFHDLLVGENPLDVERLWDKMYHGKDLSRASRNGYPRYRCCGPCPLGHSG